MNISKIMESSCKAMEENIFQQEKDSIIKGHIQIYTHLGNISKNGKKSTVDRTRILHASSLSQQVKPYHPQSRSSIKKKT